MFFNLFLFILVIILYVLFNFNKKNNLSNLIFLRICFVLFFILSSIRGYEIGTDTIMYVNLFSKCANGGWDVFSWDSYFEPLYLILNIIIGLFSKSNRFFIVVISFILNYAVYKFIKNNSKNYFFSVLVYIGMLFFYTSMTMLRQFIAIIICLYATKYAKEKKLFSFIICVCIAFGFHSSALLALLYYPCYNLKYSKKYIFIIIFACLLSALFLEPLVNIFMNLIGRTNYYTDRFGSENISNVLFFIIYLLFSIFIILEKKNNQNIPSSYVYIFLFAMGFNFIAINMNIIGRGAEYFNIFSLIVIPNVLNDIKFKNNKFIFELIFFVFLLLYSSSIIYLRPNWNSAYNYNTCFNSEYEC